MTKENSRYNNGRRISDMIATLESGKAIEGLKEKCFYDPKLRLVFAAIATLFRERTAVDLVTVTERLRTDGNLTTVGGPSRLAELTQQVSSAANIDL